MTVSSNATRWSYTASGSNPTFAYENLIFADTDLEVYLDGALQSLSDYAVTGVGNPAGGNVVFNANPGAGVAVLIVLAVANTQPTEFLDNGRFPAAAVEAAVDRLTILGLQRQTDLDRSLRQPETDTATIDRLPDASTRANKLLSFDSDGDPVAATPTTTIVTSATESAAGIAELATQAETNAGVDDARIVTPAKLAGRTATTSRAGVVELATTAEMNAGTDADRAPSVLAIAQRIGWQPLARFAPTAAATFAISGAGFFATTYSVLRLTLVNIRPATDNDDLRLRVSIAGSIKSGASDYAWQYKALNITGSTEGTSNDGADSEIEIAENIGNAATEGLAATLLLYSPASTAVVKQIEWNAVFFNGSTQLTRARGEGAYVAGTEALDQLVFHWQGGGNFAAVGEAFLEGLRTT